MQSELKYYIYRQVPNRPPYLYGMASNKRLSMAICLKGLVDNPKCNVWVCEKPDPYIIGTTGQRYWHDRYQEEGMDLVLSYFREGLS